MCGFIGCLYSNPQHMSVRTKGQWRQRNAAITHRGPNDEGYYYDKWIHLGFSRLSIIDIDHGHQPMSYTNERYWIVFNGEIYNHIALRKELKELSVFCQTNSDTEVLLALYSHFKENMVQKIRGMFAFVIWDKVNNKVFGARDHFGIKPLYYLEEETATYYASETKSIWDLVDKEINQESLQHFLSFQYVPEPETMMDGIKKLPAGHYFTQTPGSPIEIKKYWKPAFSSLLSSEAQATTEIQYSLMDSVQSHMKSDVPVGAFLSGGIDSTIITSLAKQLNPHIKTFSVGFEEKGFSEVDVAKQTADALNIENISYVVSPEEFIHELPRIVYHMDDPLADPAAVPLYFVAREASRHVKVVLSGEGADELFGGYNIYREPSSLRTFTHLPSSSKTCLRALSHFLPDNIKGKSFIQRGTTSLESRYIGNAKVFEEKDKMKLLKNYQREFPYTKITKPLFEEAAGYDAVTKMQYIDVNTWLPGDILLKADKMTMAHSLELRVPFLDKNVFEVASKIDPHFKINGQTTKYILREAARGIVPEHVLNRKELGFPVPLRKWLKNELYAWAMETVQNSQTDHIFNKKKVIQLIEQHAQTKKDYSRKIWTILIFMIWHQIYIEKSISFIEEDKIRRFSVPVKAY